MGTLQKLSTSDTVLLFTPVVCPEGSGKASNRTRQQVDPFEILGRALSRHHRRIRHVPYVPKVGFTETHDAFLSHADVVIVLICEPESDKHESLANQIDFAEATLEGHEGGGYERCPGRPLLVIRCGSLKEALWPDMSQFNNLVKCKAYNADTAVAIAGKLFERK